MNYGTIKEYDIADGPGAVSYTHLDVYKRQGQMFPGNLVTDMMWENSYGYLKKGKMHNIVTSGLGVFGPDMSCLLYTSTWRHLTVL